MALPTDLRDRLKLDPAGLIAAIVQQHDTGEVLMLGWMDVQALERTLHSGRTTFWSRSRQEYWVKGETSGNRQWVREVRLDCDGDALLVRVDQEGAACHTGSRTCFDDDVLQTTSLDGVRPAGSEAAFQSERAVGQAAERAVERPVERGSQA